MNRFKQVNRSLRQRGQTLQRPRWREALPHPAHETSWRLAQSRRLRSRLPRPSRCRWQRFSQLVLYRACPRSAPTGLDCRLPCPSYQPHPGPPDQAMPPLPRSVPCWPIPSRSKEQAPARWRAKTASSCPPACSVTRPAPSPLLPRLPGSNRSCRWPSQAACPMPWVPQTRRR